MTGNKEQAKNEPATLARDILPRNLQHGPVAETVVLPGLIGTGKIAKVRPACRCGWHGDALYFMDGNGIKEALRLASLHVADAIGSWVR